MKPHLFLGLLAGTAAIAFTAAEPAHARACPADLSGLSGQISDPKLSLSLQKTFDTLVAEAGTLSAAIARAEAKLDDLEARRSALAADASDAEKSLYDQAIAIGEARVSGLKCRLGN